MRDEVFDERVVVVAPLNTPSLTMSRIIIRGSDTFVCHCLAGWDTLVNMSRVCNNK